MGCRGRWRHGRWYAGETHRLPRASASSGAAQPTQVKEPPADDRSFSSAVKNSEPASAPIRPDPPRGRRFEAAGARLSRGIVRAVVGGDVVEADPDPADVARRIGGAAQPD